MRKLLTILTAITLTSSASTAVVSCGITAVIENEKKNEGGNDNTNTISSKDINEEIKNELDSLDKDSSEKEINNAIKNVNNKHEGITISGSKDENGNVVINVTTDQDHTISNEEEINNNVELKKAKLKDANIELTASENESKPTEAELKNRT